ncbi:hypothetical protein FNF28_05676 [Cafeteria roenbergensis]|nr:hypothetical protein FNF28_05676 [Cafeteria roenbergensis]
MRGGSIASSLVCLLGDERHGRVPTVTGEDRTLRMPSGAAIHARFWGIPSLPDGSAPRALVLLVHGYGHYMDGFFDRLASELCALGLACAGVDLPGHGLSDGDRGLVVPIVECAEAALRVRQEAYLDLPSGLPCIFYGESLGGAVATMAATLAPADCQALCLMWPLMGVPAPPNTVTHVFLSVLAALCPGLVVRAAVEAGDYSFADPKKREDTKTDPHRYAGGMRAGSAARMLAAGELMLAAAKSIRCPVFAVHSATDIITSAARSREWVRSLAVTDKQHVLVDAGAHNLWWEPSDLRSKLLATIGAWMRERADLARSAKPSERAAGLGNRKAVPAEEQEVSWPAGSGAFDPVEVAPKASAGGVPVAAPPAAVRRVGRPA